jgi:Zn-finger nucleic acid-binding protein
MWLDAGELDRVVQSEHAAGVMDAPPDTRKGQRVRHMVKPPAPLACPRDRTPLILKEHWEQPHVDVDQCPDCRGVLLDPGELRDLSQWTMRERLMRAWQAWQGGE